MRADFKAALPTLPDQTHEDLLVRIARDAQIDSRLLGVASDAQIDSRLLAAAGAFGMCVPEVPERSSGGSGDD